MNDRIRPPTVQFPGVVTEEWATSVAEHLYDATRSNPDVYLVIRELWIGEDLALYCRHVRMGSLLGVRFGHLDTNPTTEAPAANSAELGHLLYHALHDTPDVREWRDAAGFEWWGDVPVESWDVATGGTKIATVVR